MRLLRLPVRKGQVVQDDSCLLTILLLAIAFLLSGCNWFGSVQRMDDREVVSAGHWQTTRSWVFRDMPEELATLTQGKVTLSARCYFKPQVFPLKASRQGVMLPVLGVSESFSMAPQLEHTGEMFGRLKKHWNLGKPMESVLCYQRLLSSVEHACPPNLSRDIPSCSFRKWLPFGWGTHASLYDASRMEQWFKEHPDVGYIIYQPADIYQSEAVLNLGYSLHKDAITRQMTEKRRKLVESWLGKYRVDWVALQEPGKMPALTSENRVGFCEMVWEEFDEKKTQLSRHLTVSQIQQVHRVLWPEFCQVVSAFMDELTVAESRFAK